MLTFDAVEHRYFWNGTPVPNVTRVLGPLTDYSRVDPEALETARQKGIAVHRMVELHAQGQLDEDALPEWMRPVLAFWRKFVADTGFELIASEEKVFHPMYRYAGTLDLRCRLTKTAMLGPGIIDVKRSFVAGKVIGFQTAAYAEAVKAERIQWRGALRLREDAPYRFKPYTDMNDFTKFLVCLSFHRLKEELQ